MYYIYQIYKLEFNKQKIYLLDIQSLIYKKNYVIRWRMSSQHIHQGRLLR